jgi:dihydroorotate dehydrogenase electron transfer subunit
MAKVIYNKKLSDEFYLMRVKAPRNKAKMGQFYMLRAWDKYPVLSRPLSVFDADSESVTFLIKRIGEGTQILTDLKKDDDIEIQGPLGNTYPQVHGKIALVGGGVGIAPLYFTAKTLKKSSPNSQIDIYLGFSDEAILEHEYKEIADTVIVDVGGFITDKVDPTNYNYIFTCGPEIMMKVLYKKCIESEVPERLTVSMENRMACGIGACLVCTCKTKQGNKKVCKDGPVFPAKEVL